MCSEIGVIVEQFITLPFPCPKLYLVSSVSPAKYAVRLLNTPQLPLGLKRFQPFETLNLPK
jgi:hypothetical protein